MTELTRQINGIKWQSVSRNSNKVALRELARQYKLLGYGTNITIDGKQHEILWVCKNQWLGQNCKECITYPDCDFVERLSSNPRGCSLFTAQSTNIDKWYRQQGKLPDNPDFHV